MTDEDTVLTTTLATPLELSPSADGFVKSDDTFTDNSQLQVKNASGTNVRKTYVQFDVSGAPEPLADAELQFTVASSAGGTTDPNRVWGFNVYALNDGNDQENWTEGSFTYNTAPGNDLTDGGAADAAEATLVGNFSLTGTGTPGEVIRISDTRLVDFLSQDTDGKVTFIITRADAESGGDNIVHNFSSSETGNAPALILRTSLLDNDPTGSTLVSHDTTSAQGAAVTVNADGTFSYDPTSAPALQALNDGESVIDTFSYTYNDGSNDASALVSVLVHGVDGPVVTLAPASPDASEITRDGRFIVMLDKASGDDLTVTYEVSGTATPGSDFTPLTGQVTIPAGQTSATIDVPILDDDEDDDGSNETVIVTLTGVSGAVIGEASDFQEGVSPSGAYVTGATYIRSIGFADDNLNDDTDGGGEMILGRSTSDMHLLLEFDLSSFSGNPGSVELNLTRGGSNGGNPFTASLFEYNFDFDEATTTWNNPGTGDATPGGTPGNLLGTLGMDPNDPSGTRYTFANTPAFSAAVSRALAAGDSTLRLLITSDAANGEFIRFRNDEYTGGNAQRPELSVTPSEASLGATLSDTLTIVDSVTVTGDSAGSFVTADTVSVDWDSTAEGASGVSSVTMDFSDFGGPGAVAASDIGGGVYRATYNLVPGSLEDAEARVSLTVSFSGGGSRTGTDDSVFTVTNLSGKVYVDPSFTTPGATITDADAGTGGNQAAVVGTNAFASIAQALNNVPAFGKVVVNSGIYNESITLDNGKVLDIGGPDVAQAVSIEAISSLSGTSITIEGSSTLTVADPSGETIAGFIAGTGDLVKDGNDLLTLGGANTFSGGTTVANGILRLTGPGALGSGSVGITVQNGGTLELADGVTISGRTVELSGSGSQFRGAISTGTGESAIWDGNVVLSSNARLGAGAGGTLEITGDVSGGNLVINGQVNEDSLGTILLSGTTSYSGSSQIVRGVLALGGPDTLPTSATLNIHSLNTPNTASLDLRGNSQTLNGIIRGNSNGPGTIVNSGATTGTLTITGSSAFSGEILGDVLLVVDNGNTLTLGGANSHTGGTTIGAGATIALDGDGSIGTGVIRGSGTLDTSTANSKTVTATIAPGANTGSIATFTINGDLDFDGTLLVDIDGTSNDQLLLTGGTSLDLAALKIAGQIISDNANPFVVVDNQTGQALTAGPATELIAGKVFDADYTTGNDVTLTRQSDPPVITFSDSDPIVVDTNGNILVNEDSGPHTVDPFIASVDPGGSSETIDDTGGRYTVTTSEINHSAGGGPLFSSAPAIDNAGVLSFTLSANANGSARVSVSVTDSAGITETRIFTITVRPVHDDAGFNLGGDEAPGKVDEAFALSNLQSSVTGLFPNAVSIIIESLPESGNGVLSLNGTTTIVEGNEVVITDLNNLIYTPDTGGSSTWNGTLRFTFHVRNADGSEGSTLFFASQAARESPLKAEAAVNVSQDAGPVMVENFATVIPGDHDPGSLVFQVSTTRAELFSEAPSLDRDGTLRFTPAPDASGITVVTVNLTFGSRTLESQSFLLNIQRAAAVTDSGESPSPSPLTRPDGPSSSEQTVVSLPMPSLVFDLVGRRDGLGSEEPGFSEVSIGLLDGNGFEEGLEGSVTPLLIFLDPDEFRQSLEAIVWDRTGAQFSLLGATAARTDW